MEHLTMVPSVPLPSNGSKKRSSLPNERRRSYVWHYFNRLGNMVKCRVCQHELKTKADRSTTELLWHLKRTHELKHGTIRNNFSSLPTKLTQSTNLRLCMRERVLRSFVENSGDIWRCIQCNYAIEDKQILSMFQHLKITHWKASRPARALIQINNNQIAESGTEAPEITKTQNLGDKMSLFVDLSPGNCPKTAINKEENALGGDPLKDSNSVELNLLGENKVEGVGVGSKDGPENVESAISLDHSYRNEQLQSITPMVWEEAISNEQRAEEGYGTLENDANNPEVLTGDDKTKFDHWYSRKSGTEPVATTSRQIKVQKTLPAIKKSCSPRNGSGEIKQKELDSQVEIQVPLQNLLRFNADTRNTNGETPINYQYIETEKAGKQQNVAVITLSRPKTLNALNIKLMDELNDAVIRFDSDKDIGAIIITGSETAFAAGNDIKEMQNLTYARTINENVLRRWNGISKANKPVIAAVNGYAVGGGCELAMMCDIIYAGNNALFGQPEIVIGTIPGAGGTQRLTRVIGKSKAMEMVLTGNEISAVEAEEFGLVSKVFPPDQVLSEAIKLGERIYAHSPLIVAMAKEAVNSAYETTLQEGLRLEAKLFSGTLATADRREGMAAFLAKRAPNFKNE